MMDPRARIGLLLFAALALLMLAGQAFAAPTCTPPCGSNQYCQTSTNTCFNCHSSCSYGCTGPGTGGCNPAPIPCVYLGSYCGSSGGGAACCSGQGMCVESGGVYTCQTCIPRGSSSGCSNDNQCCQGINIELSCAQGLDGFSESGANFKPPRENPPEVICKVQSLVSHTRQCEYCSNLGQWCGADADCCGVYDCRSNHCSPPNSPPAAPAAPVIAPEGYSFLQATGTLACTSNCPPSPLPVDPDGQAVSMSYLWHKNGVPVGSWGAYSAFSCTSNGCQNGQVIYLKSKACDTMNACSESSSNQVTVGTPPPTAPAAPIIVPIGPSVTPGTGARCTNCPPNPMPIDPISGNPASIQYAWVNGGTQLPWASTYSDFSCLASGCTVGGQISMKIRACNSATPSACTSEIGSASSLTVQPQVAAVAGTLDPAYSVLALGAAVGILALAFMASYVFNLPHIRPIIQDEGLQVLATGAILLGIIGVNAAIDSYLSNALGMAAGTSFANVGSAIDAAKNSLSGLETKVLGMYGSFDTASRNLGQEGSKGVFCSFLGVGFSLANCSPFNAFRGTTTTASFASTGALADIYAQQYLLSLARNLSFTFLIPLGLLLRCFKMTRGAGGALIAIGFGFYTAYPLTIVATDSLLHGSNPSSTVQPFPGVPACDPTETDVDYARGDVMNFATSLSNFDMVEERVYILLVRVVFASILSLMITLAFIRALAHIIGSEIDVSALARIS